MRSFFVQIFLSFWISGILTFFLTAVIFPNPAHPSPDTMQVALGSSLAQLARSEIKRGLPAATKARVPYSSSWTFGAGMHAEECRQARR